MVPGIRLPALAALVAILGGVPGAASPCPPAPAVEEPCPPDPASVAVFVENLSAEASVNVDLTGELLCPTATCAATGDGAYEASLTCTGSGLVRCGELTNLAPGSWVNRLAVTVAGSDPQIQARRAVFIAGSGASNNLAWTVYPRTFVVPDATEASLRARLDAAAEHPGLALVTFSRAAFPGAGAPRTIDLSKTPCVPDRTRRAALCFTGSRVVVDALDAQGDRGGGVWSVGGRPISVLRLYGSDNVLRGLVFQGTQEPSPVNQVDTIAIAGPAARRNRIEQSVIVDPTLGDALSVGEGAGEGERADDAIVVEDCDVRNAHNKGIKATDRGRVRIERTCVHGNRGGDVQATKGGRADVVESLVQRNLPGPAGHGLSATGNDIAWPSTLTTGGNIVRFAGARGLSVTDHTGASFADDYVADNQFVGSEVETTGGGAAGPAPRADFRGVALVCNRNGGLTSTCQPQGGDDANPCGNDLDCCGLDGGCCVADAGCAAPLRCVPGSFPRGFGAAQAAADGQAAPEA